MGVHGASQLSAGLLWLPCTAVAAGSLSPSKLEQLRRCGSWLHLGPNEIWLFTGSGSVKVSLSNCCSWVLVHRASLGLVLNEVGRKNKSLNFCQLNDLMVLRKPWSGSKRGFCGFRFLPSQLLAGKHDTWLLFLWINYIFVTLRKQGLIQMSASFLVRECKKGGGMNAEAQTERGVWSRKAGMQVCFCSVSLPRVCSCLHSGAGLCICNLLSEVIIGMLGFIIKKKLGFEETFLAWATCVSDWFILHNSS